MSTRATYSFDFNFNPSKTHIVNFYIHHDGYPEGAAYYFWNMHKAKHYRGGLSDRFIKSNSTQCELTISHEFHTDTEYRYFISGEGYLIAKKDDYEKGFITFFEGHYAEFINKYCEIDPSEETFEKLHKVGTTSQYLTLVEVKEQILDLYSKYLDGHDWYRSQLEDWTNEYQRLTNSSKK